MWAVYTPRICLLQGILAQAAEKTEEALRYFSIALDVCSSTDMELSAVTRTAIVCLRIASGQNIQAAHALNGRSSKRSSNGKDSEEDLDQFVKTLLQDCDGDDPSLKMIGLIVQALTMDEIVKAKSVNNSSKRQLNANFSAQSLPVLSPDALKSDEQPLHQAPDTLSSVLLLHQYS